MAAGQGANLRFTFKRHNFRTFIIAAVLMLLTYGGYKGIELYLLHGPLPPCREIPVKNNKRIDMIDLSTAKGISGLGPRVGTACPEAGRSFFEWYFLVIHEKDYYLEALLYTRGVNRRLSIAGVGVFDARTLKPLFIDIETAKKAQWAEHGCDIRIFNKGAGAGRGNSYFVYHEKGPEAGSFEINIHTAKVQLNAFLDPLSPGMVSGQVVREVTRPGTWMQFSSPVIMAGLRGRFSSRLKDGVEKVYDLSTARTGARAYLEHSWGQGQHDRFYWDWGEFGDPGRTEYLVFGQFDGADGGIDSFLAAGRGKQQMLAISNDPPGQNLRVFYSRFYRDGELLFPQQIFVCGYGAASGQFINMSGSQLGQYGGRMAIDLYGRAGNDLFALDWSKRKVKSVVELYKGAQTANRHPPSPDSVQSECDARGCRLRWRQSECDPGMIEYWVLRAEERSLAMEGIPVGSVKKNCRVSAAVPMEFHDPNGNSSHHYIVIPVSIPNHTLHNRPQAGYPVSSRQPKSQGGAGQYPATGKEARGDFKLVHIIKGDRAGRRIRIDNQSNSGAQLLLETNQGSGWVQTRVLPPRFAPGVQIESLDAVLAEANILAAAWSERTPLPGKNSFTNWQIFLCYSDLSSGAYRIVPVSMTSSDATGVSIQAGPGLADISWTECSAEKCFPATQSHEVLIP